MADFDWKAAAARVREGNAVMIEEGAAENARLRAKLTLVMELLAEEKVPMTPSVRSVCVREIRETLGLPVNEGEQRNVDR